MYLVLHDGTAQDELAWTGYSAALGGVGNVLPHRYTRTDVREHGILQLLQK